MTAFRVLTDSNCHIPPALCHELGIQVIPIPYVWNGKTYLDGVDIPAGEFYQRLRTTRQLPTTSAPTPGNIIEAIRKLQGDDEPILAIFVGSDFSSTVVTAKVAVQELDREDITVVDSMSNGLALGFQVLAAARAAREGASLEEAVELAATVRSSSGVVFAVSDLHHLRRGGRIGLAQSIVGSVIKTIPILEIDHGPVKPITRTRTEARAIVELLDQVEKRLGSIRPYRLGILHSDAESAAWELKAAAEKRFQPDELIIQQLNSILAIHVGPDAFGLAYSFGL